MYDSLARYYDIVHSSLTDDQAYILKLAKETGGPVLELGCGTGRILVPLARAGHTVVGVDNSQAMLARASDHLAREPAVVQKRVDLVDADMKILLLTGKDRHFSLVLLPYNTLLHFRSEEIQQLLRHVSSYLHHEGRLFIDVTNPFIIDQLSDDPQPVLENIYFDQETSEMVRQLSQSRLDTKEQRLHTTWIFEVKSDLLPVSDSKTIEYDYWYHYPHQLQLYLQQAGFRFERMLGGYDGSPFGKASERLLIVARLLS